MKIVTGYTGTKHITSADDQARNLGIVGGNLSVLPVGSQFAPTYNDLTLTVADGDAVFQGVHCRQVGTYAATFTRPASGKYRCDVLAVRYGNTAGVESVDYVTKKGTETTNQNNITVPSVTAGDIRGGATLAEAALFNVYMSVAGIYKVELVPPVVKSLSMLRDEMAEMPTRAEVDSLINKTAITQIKTSLTDYIDALPNNMLANLWSSAVDGNTVGSPTETTYPMYYRVRKVNASTAIIEANVMGNGTNLEKTYIKQKYGASGWSDWIQS